MAESNGQEKTEQPTSKRRNDARKDGNVFQSKDIVTVVMLFGVFYMARIMLPFMYETMRDFMRHFFSAIADDDPFGSSPHIYVDAVVAALKCALPLLLASMALGILAHGIQTRFLVTFKPLRPKFSKLNPIKGIKNLFSLKKVVELVKNLIKITILIVLLYNIVRGDLVPVAQMFYMPTLNAAAYTLTLVFDLVKKVCLAFAVIAFFDFLYQRWDYENNLKMTKQEVKEEYKNTEGDPKVKSKIRSIQRQMALSRMMQSVPEADVVIRNPTHFAVALKYDPDSHGAPVVLALGQDYMALRIIKTASESGVTIVENRPLARGLYASCEPGREIPAEFYGAVAEILVYVYRINNREEMFRQPASD